MIYYLQQVNFHEKKVIIESRMAYKVIIMVCSQPGLRAFFLHSLTKLPNCHMNCRKSGNDIKCLKRKHSEYMERWKRQEIIPEHSGGTPGNRDELCDGREAFLR